MNNGGRRILGLILPVYLLSVSGSQIVGTLRKQGEGKLRLVWSVEGAVAGKEGETTAFSVPRVFRRSFHEYSREYEARLPQPKSKRSKRHTRKRKSSSSSPASFHLPSVDLKTFFPIFWNNQEARILSNCLVAGRLFEKSRVRLPIWPQILDGRCDAMHVLSPTRRRSINVKRGHGRGTSSWISLRPLFFLPFHPPPLFPPFPLVWGVIVVDGSFFKFRMYDHFGIQIV